MGQRVCDLCAQAVLDGTRGLFHVAGGVVQAVHYMFALHATFPCAFLARNDL